MEDLLWSYQMTRGFFTPVHFTILLGVKNAIKLLLYRHDKGAQMQVWTQDIPNTGQTTELLQKSAGIDARTELSPQQGIYSLIDSTDGGS